MTEWRQRRLQVPGDDMAHDTGFDVFTLSSPAPGPTVTVLGGVHGDELAGVMAAGRISGSRFGLRRGTLVVVPVCNELAFHGASRTTPADGRNLARCFPGDMGGSVTQRLAALIAGAVLDRADLLIDLHTASANSDMPRLVGYIDDGSDAAGAAEAAARAFAMPLLWRHATCPPGRTVSFMHDRNRPAIYAEAPGGAEADLDTVDLYIAGVMRVLGQLGLTSSRVRPAKVERVVTGGGDLDNDVIHASEPGFFIRDTHPGQLVAEGAAIGHLEDMRGRVRQTVSAPTSGYVVYLRKATYVRRGDSLTCIATPC